MHTRVESCLTIGIGIAVLSSSLLRAQVTRPNSSVVSACWTEARSSKVPSANEACLAVWIDSLRSQDAGTSSLAREALAFVGGRAAVDALRANYDQRPSWASRLAVITAMATIGSPDDVAFLATQIQGPFTGNSDIWPVTQAAATTLGLLRATAAHDALSAALGRYGPSGFAGRAVATALASLDRPPCADSVRGELNRELVRIVMNCGPESMQTSSRYRDVAAGGTWRFTNGTWQLVTSIPADTATTPKVSSTVTLSSDGRGAEVYVSTWCGGLCGEGWSFRLLLSGNTWRVVSAAMRWVS